MKGATGLSLYSFMFPPGFVQRICKCFFFAKEAFCGLFYCEILLCLFSFLCTPGLLSSLLARYPAPHSFRCSSVWDGAFF